MDFNKDQIDSFFNDNDNQQSYIEIEDFIKNFKNKNDNKILKNCMKYIDEHDDCINELYDAMEHIPELIVTAKNECNNSIRKVLSLIKQQAELFGLQKLENQEKYEQKIHELNFTTSINKLKLMDLLANQNIVESELKYQLNIAENKIKSQDIKNKILMNMIKKNTDENIKLQFTNQVLLKQMKKLTERIDKLESKN